MKALEVAEDALMAAENTRADGEPESAPVAKDVPAGTPRWGPAEPEEVLADNEDTAGTRRADALRWLAEHFLDRPPEVSDTQSYTDRYQVVVHIDQRLLAGEITPSAPDSERPECCGIEPDRKLAVETARRLACDSGLVGLVESEDREPLSVGRRTRAGAFRASRPSTRSADSPSTRTPPPAAGAVRRSTTTSRSGGCSSYAIRRACLRRRLVNQPTALLRGPPRRAL
jgi:hypothetical protein